MIYKLKFLKIALKEWKKLGPPLKMQFKKKLNEILHHPHIKANQLRGYPDIYKIKLRASGYRLAYKVIDKDICVVVISISKRDKNKIYDNMKNRLN